MSAENDKSGVGLGGFFAVAAVLFVLRLLFASVIFPPGVATALSVASGVIFIALPIWGMFMAGRHAWKWGHVGLLILVGIALHLGGLFGARSMPETGLATVTVGAIAQTGVLFWAVGLGAAVALLIKERNLLLPIALFLAGFDVFLVFAPTAPTARMVESRSNFFQSVAMAIPRARVETPEAPQSKGARVELLSQVGPADLIFITTFFVCLFRFGMRVKETVRWLVPVMVLYLFLAMSPIGIGMLPALVPVGLTVLIVNRKEFQMTKEEKQATIGVGILALLLAIAGITLRALSKPKEPPAEPATADSVPGPPGSAGSPAPAPLD